MKKKWPVFFIFFFLSQFAHSQSVRPTNAEFFTKKISWMSDKTYADEMLKENIKRLDRGFNRPNWVSDSCSMEGADTKSDVLSTLAKFSFGKVKCSKLETTSPFYTPGDIIRCDMDVTLMLQNYSKELQDKYIQDGNEETLKNYWTEDRLKERWFIAAQALKRCKIRVANIQLISFENVGDFVNSEPVFSFRSDSDADRIFLSPFQIKESKNKRVSIKFVYAKDILRGSARDNRGDEGYGTASTRFTDVHSDPSLSSAWLKADSLAIPIQSNENDKNDTGYVDEIHELFHILTKKTDLECHIDSKKNPDVYNPMTNSFVRGGPMFDVSQCEQMRTLGAQYGFLRCTPYDREYKPKKN